VPGPAQANFGDNGNDKLLMCQSLLVLISDESDVDSWSSEGEELMIPFDRMDDESSEDDLDYFMALDLSVAKSSPRVAPTATESSSRVAPTASRGKRRIEVLKQSVEMIGEPSQGMGVPRRRRHMGMERSRQQEGMQSEEGTRRIILAPMTGQYFEEGDMRSLFYGEELKLMLFMLELANSRSSKLKRWESEKWFDASKCNILG
jgi:hypothetical protein